MTPATSIPLCCLAASTTTELLELWAAPTAPELCPELCGETAELLAARIADACGDDPGLPGTAAGLESGAARCAAPERPESESRLRRSSSERISLAP